MMWALLSVTVSATGWTDDLMDLSLTELANITVTTVSKREESLMNTASAVYVITGQDIRRSGARTLPDALRLAPGAHVAQITSNKWAVSIRGFNNLYANKLLVLVDGRSVYTPLFSGVYWDMQDVAVEDIDRIEVIRGPGAVMWGANAVNGVINIITRQTDASQGVEVLAGGGDVERRFGALRVSGGRGEQMSYRAYLRSFRRGSLASTLGGDGRDDWSMTRAGARFDWQLAPEETLMLETELYDGHADDLEQDPQLTPPFVSTAEQREQLSGASLAARWTRGDTDGGETSWQFNYERNRRSSPSWGELRDIFDLDYQRTPPPSGKHQWTWGADARLTSDQLSDGPAVSFSEDSRTDLLLSAFVQDSISVRPEKMWLTVGTKLEHNDYSGFEIQPSVRVLWRPQPDRAVWAAVSRAVRTPARSDFTARLNVAAFPDPGTGTPTLIQLRGNSTFDSEDVLTYEVGYRAQPEPTLSYDLTLFINDYDNLRTFEPSTPEVHAGPPAHVIVPWLFANQMEGRSYGLELAADWRPRNDWRLTGSYSLLRSRLRLKPGSTDTVSAANSSPTRLAQLRSQWNLRDDVDVDVWVSYVGGIPASGVARYTRADVRLGWRPRDGVEVSLVGQNVLDSRHTEFGTALGEVPTQPERSFILTYSMTF